MAKPILVIRIHYSASDRFKEIRGMALKAVDNEYHVLMVAFDESDVKFETYNVDNQPEIDYEQLKELINEISKS